MFGSTVDLLKTGLNNNARQTTFEPDQSHSATSSDDAFSESSQTIHNGQRSICKSIEIKTTPDTFKIHKNRRRRDMEAIKKKVVEFPYRRTTTQIVNLGVMISSALMIWKIWVCLFGTISPLTVVLSGSMEPGFQRGDALLIYYNNDPIRVGEIVVFTVEGQEISIVHRVIEVHQERNATDVKYILTKGDNNYGDDSWGIYLEGQKWLEQKNVQGKIIGILRYAGWPTIIMNDYPLVKYFLLGSLSLMTILAD